MGRWAGGSPAANGDKKTTACGAGAVGSGRSIDWLEDGPNAHRARRTIVRVGDVNHGGVQVHLDEESPKLCSLSIVRKRRANLDRAKRSFEDKRGPKLELGSEVIRRLAPWRTKNGQEQDTQYSQERPPKRPYSHPREGHQAARKNQCHEKNEGSRGDEFAGHHFQWSW